MISMPRALVIVAGLCIVAVLAEDIVRSVSGGTFARWKLVPWMIPIALALWIPIHQLVRARRIDAANPFIYCTLTYFAPALALGTLLFIITGISDIPPALVNEPAYDYPLALLHTAIAIASFGLGVNLASAGTAGQALGAKLPAWRWPPEMLLVPGLLFFVVGGMLQLVNFSTGTIGFQLPDAGRFTAAMYFIGLLFNFGQFMLWFAIFSAPKLDWRYIGVGAVMLILLPLFAALAGSRGYLFSAWLIAALACFTTGRRPTFARIVALVAVGALSLSLGIAFGSSFRALKAVVVVATEADGANQRSKAGVAPAPSTTAPPTSAPSTTAPPTVEEATRMAQRRISVGEQFELARAAAATAATGGMLSRTLRGLAARLDTVTALAVLVSNRKKLEDKLPATLSSGIWIGLATALIPRAIWPNKPVIGDVRSHSALFFDLPSNAFAITPYGDLLLNFGPLGIAPGMFLLGALMRLMYTSLIEQLPGAAGRAAVYLLLLSQLSMEALFSTIIPSFLRAGLIAVLAALITAVIVSLLSRFRMSHA